MGQDLAHIKWKKPLDSNGEKSEDNPSKLSSHQVSLTELRTCLNMCQAAVITSSWRVQKTKYAKIKASCSRDTELGLWRRERSKGTVLHCVL